MPHHLSPGTQLGRHVVEDLIGSGGMGAVPDFRPLREHPRAVDVRRRLALPDDGA